MTDLAQLRALLADCEDIMPLRADKSDASSGDERADWSVTDDSGGYEVARELHEKPAALIVAAVNALPGLLDRLEAAERDRDHIQNSWRGLNGQYTRWTSRAEAAERDVETYRQREHDARYAEEQIQRQLEAAEAEVAQLRTKLWGAAGHIAGGTDELARLRELEAAVLARESCADDDASIDAAERVLVAEIEKSRAARGGA